MIMNGMRRPVFGTAPSVSDMRTPTRK